MTLVASDNIRGDDGFGSFFQSDWNQNGNTRRRGGQPYYQMRRNWW